VGVGINDTDTDYYRPYLGDWSGREIGVSAWANYSIYHGFGVEVEGNSIFANKPKPIFPNGETGYGSVSEETIEGGIIYKYHEFHKLHPFAKGLGGLGKVNFPSNNPFYTSESAGVWSLGGGAEYRIWRTVFLRGQYEYQWWKGFRGGEGFNPSPITFGATYYLRGVHRHY
jgi:opacity protein-like surface antigen